MSCCAPSNTCTPAATSFSKFGKNVKDLFKKNYDFGQQVKVTQKPINGVTLETNSTLSDALNAHVKAKYVDRSFGEFEIEADASPAALTTASLKLKELAKGLIVTVGTKSNFSNASVDVEYSKNSVNTQVTAASDLQFAKPSVTVSGVYNHSQINLGAQLALVNTDGSTCSFGGSCPVGYKLDVAAELNRKDFTASLFTEKNLSVINASYLQVCGKSQYGAQYSHNMKGSCCGSSKDSVTLGLQHNINATTFIKAKADIPTGVVGYALEHKIPDIRTTIGLAAQFNALDNFNSSKPVFQPAKFGVSVTYDQ